MASLPSIPPSNLHKNLLHPFKTPSSISFKSRIRTLTRYQQVQSSYFMNVSSFSRDGQLQQALDVISHMKNNGIIQIEPQYYAELLQGCVYERALLLGQQIHGFLIKKGDIYIKNDYIETKLVIFYAKCDDFENSSKMFNRLCSKNVFSWAAIIGLKSRLGLNEEAIMGYCKMLESGVFPDNFVIPNVLKACGASQCVLCGKGIHGYVIKVGFDGCVYVASSLVDMYGKCGKLDDARKVFDEMVERNVVGWNSMVVSYVQNGMNEEAIQMFNDMRVEGIEPTRVSISSLLSASANLGAVEEGRQGHALAVLYGFELGSILGSSIINFYSKIGWVEHAELVFARMEEKDVVTWNLLISCYVQNGLIENAVNMCYLMRSQGLNFDCVTLASLISAFAGNGDVKLAKEAHGYCIRNRLVKDVVLTSSLVDMYAKGGKIEYARRVFDSFSEKDLVLWNTLLAAYAELGLSGEVLKLFYEMQMQGFHPNVVSWNSLLLALLRCQMVDEAKTMFTEMQAQGVGTSVVTWTTLITGLAQNGLGFDAMLLFQQMIEAGVQPNAVSLTALLSACINMTSLLLGKAVHSYVIRQYYHISTEIATSLVEMYAKCGSIAHAKKVFDMVSEKELALYNAMISAYGLHSQALKALTLYEYMQAEGIRPDDVTFTGILSACSHEGLVDQGINIFTDIASKYNGKPKIEHYGCLVTLLCRCDNLDEAINLILGMPTEPDDQILGSIISACRKQNQTELGEYLSKYLFQREPTNSANYVTLSNVYAAAGEWSKVSEWRNFMKRQGLKKNPGCSWIQIGSESHVFMAGDASRSDDITAVLSLLQTEMTSKHSDIAVEVYSSL